MIKYNIRFNGSWEYDKFVLNYFNLYNEIKYLESELNTNNTLNKTVDDLYNKVSTNTFTKDLYHTLGHMR